MLISELAALTGMSAREPRHYEDRGLLVPARDGGGYRDYADSDVVRAAEIRTLISAGMSTSVIRRYLDCVRTGDHGTSVVMCPDLRAELDALARCLDARQAELREMRRRLDVLTSAEGGTTAAGPGPRLAVRTTP